MSAVANQIEVRPSSTPLIEIACKVRDAIRRELAFSHDQIKVTAANGSIMLAGEVDWAYQRARANAALAMIASNSATNLLAISKAAAGLTAAPQPTGAGSLTPEQLAALRAQLAASRGAGAAPPSSGAPQ